MAPRTRPRYRPYGPDVEQVPKSIGRLVDDPPAAGGNLAGGWV